MALLEQAGVRRAVLVTHAWHMPRALRLFNAAAGGKIEFDHLNHLAPLTRGGAVDWIPSAERLRARARYVLREALARLAGD